MLGMFLVKKKIKKDITLLEFYKLTEKTLYITCTDLNDYSQKVFNHIETPDVKLIDACRYACTIPFVFTVNKDNMYVDGCFSKNLPIELLPIENTIGFCFETNKKYTAISTLKDYVLKTVGCMLNRSNAFEQKLYIEKGYKIIDIPCYLNALDYKSEKEIIEKQILSGYISIFKATTA
jgi:hypothetical protein